MRTMEVCSNWKRNFYKNLMMCSNKRNFVGSKSPGRSGSSQGIGTRDLPYCHDHPKESQKSH